MTDIIGGEAATAQIAERLVDQGALLGWRKLMGEIGAEVAADVGAGRALGTRHPRQ